MSSLAERRAAARARQATASDPLPDHRWPLTAALLGTPVAVIDTETTGLDTAEARICSVAVVHVTIGRDDAVVVLDQKVNPGVPIPPEATKVHGITDADVKDAPSWRQVAPHVLAAVLLRRPAAFNAPYDQQVIAAELARVGSGIPEPFTWGTWLDPYILVRGIDKFEKGKKLRDAARRRGIQLAPHGAAGDALTTALLLTTLLEEANAGVADRFGRIRFQAPKNATVESYLRWQRAQALEQERDFASYMYGQGRSDVVECPWHVLEGVEPPAPPKRAAEPRPGATCSSCGEPLVWVITKDGRKMPTNPKVFTASIASGPPSGRELMLVTDDGDVVRCVEVPRGFEGPTIQGREAHWSSCAHAERHRKTA
jgi:DNA polymerase-3 subunit epsilon